MDERKLISIEKLEALLLSKFIKNSIFDEGRAVEYVDILKWTISIADTDNREIALQNLIDIGLVVSDKNSVANGARYHTRPNAYNEYRKMKQGKFWAEFRAWGTLCIALAGLICSIIALLI